MGHRRGRKNMSLVTIVCPYTVSVSEAQKQSQLFELEITHFSNM